MKNRLITAIILLIVLSTLGFAGCRGEPQEATERQIATVERGDLRVTVPADGNLELPKAMPLFFDTSAFTMPYSSVITWEPPDLQEGDFVREGTLLAKLDDSYQRENVKIAMYDVGLAMNELMQKIHPALMGYSKAYPDTDAALPLEQTQEELKQTQELLRQGSYQEAASKLRLARHDLEASLSVFNALGIEQLSQETDAFLGVTFERYPDITKAIKFLNQDLKRLEDIQKLIEQGKYSEALASLDTALLKLQETYSLVKSVSGRIIVSQRIGECCQQQASQQPGTSAGLMTLPYPDTSTSLDWLRQVEEDLQKIQACKGEEDCGELELATLLRMAQHDVEMSQTILEDEELVFRSGLNLKALRQYNLNLQKARATLEKAKESLLKTELLAPFDGIVENINIEKDESITQKFSSTGLPLDSYVIRLVNTKDWRMEGVVDEIDIFKVKVGQEAIITVDAMPDVELKGKVTFVSPFGTQTTGVVEFDVTIALEPSSVVTALEAVRAKEDEKKGGLTATADIIVEKHENVLLIPNRSIKGSPGDHWVEVVIDEKKVTTEKRPVILGAQNDQFSEVISGLSEGEKIIVEATRSRIPTPF